MNLKIKKVSENNKHIFEIFDEAAEFPLFPPLPSSVQLKLSSTIAFSFGT